MEDNYIIAPVVHEDGVDKVYEPIVKITDTLPTGTEVDYNGDTVPTGWEEIGDTVQATIGTTNPNNDRVWFKQSKNLFIPTLYNNGTPIQVANSTVSLNGDEFTLTATGSDMYFGQVVSSGTAYTDQRGILIPVKPGEKYYYLLTGTQFVNNLITSYDANKISKGFTNIVGNSTIYTVPNDVYYVSLRFGYNNATTGTAYKTKVLFAKSDTAINYEPYVTPSINVDGEEIYSTPVILYDNASGTSLNITLSDSVSNYDYVEIFYKDDQNFASSIKIKGSDTGFILQYNKVGINQDRIYLYDTRYTINNNTITPGIALTLLLQTSGISINGTNNLFYITKVVGYK